MIIPPGFVAIFARYTNATGHQCENVVGYAVDGVFSQTEADAASDWLAPAYKPLLNAASRYEGLHILVGQDGDALAFDSASSAGAGTAGGALSPPQVMGLIRKLSSLSGRKGRGRIFIPDIKEDWTDDSGGLNGTALGLLSDLADAWMSLADADAIFLEPVILHNSSTAPTPITAMAPENKVATQRRRFER